MRSRIFICILFIFVFWLNSANSAKAQGSDATVKKPATEPKKAATSKTRSSRPLPKTTTAKQTPKSNSSSRRKSVTETPNRRKSDDRNDVTREKIGAKLSELIESIDESGNNAALGATNSASGRWSGSWDNSQGSTGSSTINIFEEANGVITGDEDGWAIENGRRSGNILIWEYRNQNNGCRDYKIRLEISADGSLINGEYRVTDRCENLTYTGRYINYRK